MTPLHQTFDTFRSATEERFRVTVCAVFLLVNVLLATTTTPEVVAQALPFDPIAADPEHKTATSEPQIGTENPNFLTGRSFEKALDRTLSLAWQGQTLRVALQQLSATRQVAILLDRRINPEQQMSLQVKSVRLRALLQLIATEVHADVSILGNVVYIGPTKTAARLRTVEEIASSALVSGRASVANLGSPTSRETRRSFDLLKRQTLNWPDLTTPRQLLDEIGRRYSLQIIALDRVPHDLWAKSVLPAASPTQMLLAVLAQFDLSFEWTETRDGIRIIAMPDSPRVDRRFTLRPGTGRSILKLLKERMPGLEPRVTGRTITVSGTMEQLETVETLIHPERRQPRPNTRRPGGGVTIFSFEESKAPLTAFLKTLEQQAGYQFEYDEKDFLEAGIRLAKPIRLTAVKLTAEELFHVMFDAQNIAFEIDGNVIRLTPASR